MLEKIYSPLSRAIFDSDMTAIRLTLSIAEMCWGVMLLWPGDTFARTTYTIMGAVTGEYTWAAVFFLTAIFQFSIVVQDDYHGKVARYFAAWNAWLWGFVVVLIVLSLHPPPAAIGGEIALMCAAIWIWARPFIIAEGLQRAKR